MDQHTGKYIIGFGVVIVLVGIVIYFFHDRMHWIGRLPGDIRIEKERTRIYFPITTMLLFSIVITIIVNVVKRFF